MALKRKLEAQKEEKRRLEILQKRREQIREATEKYQRGNTNYSAKDYGKFKHMNDLKEYQYFWIVS